MRGGPAHAEIESPLCTRQVSFAALMAVLLLVGEATAAIVNRRIVDVGVQRSIILHQTERKLSHF